MNQKEYEIMKRSVSGFYHKFNQQVLKWNMSKMFHYETLLETAKDFDNFEDFYNHQTKGKEGKIKSIINNMLLFNKDKFTGLTYELIEKCVIVRLGNIYNGMYIENKIIETFKDLSDYISCEKTDKEIDTSFKVDAIVKIEGINQIAIQIKPISFVKYDKGSERNAHKQFTLEYDTQVFYVFYRDRENIVFNGTDVKLNNKGKIIEILENMVYNF